MFYATTNAAYRTESGTVKIGQYWHDWTVSVFGHGANLTATLELSHSIPRVLTSARSKALAVAITEGAALVEWLIGVSDHETYASSRHQDVAEAIVLAPVPSLPEATINAPAFVARIDTPTIRRVR